MVHPSNKTKQNPTSGQFFIESNFNFSISYFRGNTYFTTRSGCVRYDRCVCRCDGSWDCPARYAVNLCNDDDPDNDIANDNDTCSYCDAKGRVIASNTFFNMTEVSELIREYR